MRTTAIRFVSLFFAFALVACSNDMPVPDGGPPPPPPPGSPRLEIVGSPAVNLGYDEITDLTVRYVTDEGEPIPDAVLEWAVIGDPFGSAIGATQSVTDAAGESRMSLTSGTTNAMFSVEVTAPMGAPARFEVSVNDTIVGSITVSMTYAGTRTLVRFDAALHDGVTCGTVDPEAIPSPLRSAPSVSTITARPAFAGLEPGDAYAVTVTARNATDLAAFGCVDGIVVADGDTPVNVTLTDVDIAPDFTGVWDLDNRLDLGGALPPSTQRILDTLAEIGDDDRVDLSGDPDYELTDMDGDGYAPEYGVDPGAFITDIVMQQTCHWECLSGEDYDTCSEVNHVTGDLELFYLEDFRFWDGAQPRFEPGGCGLWTFIGAEVQNEINDTVASLLPDFIEDWAQLASDLALAITNARILSVLTISAPGAGNEFEVPMTHELVQMVVPFTNPRSTPTPGARETVTIDLTDAGLAGLSVDDVSTIDGTTLVIPEHSFMLNVGELTLYIYRNVLLDGVFGYTSTGDLLASMVDCAGLAATVYMSVPTSLSFFISESDIRGYCEAGAASIGDYLEAQLAAAIGADGTLTLEGTAVAGSVDYHTGQVDTLVDGVWSGTFTEDTFVGDVEGTFTGVRRTE